MCGAHTEVSIFVDLIASALSWLVGEDSFGEFDVCESPARTLLPHKLIFFSNFHDYAPHDLSMAMSSRHVSPQFQCLGIDVQRIDETKPRPLGVGVGEMYLSI